MARTAHPEAYRLLSQDECWREAILAIWGRAFFFVDLTKDLPNLGLETGEDAGLGVVGLHSAAVGGERVRR